MTGPAFDLRCHDSRTPWPIAPGSVHLVMGSPPYHGAGHAIEYDQYDYAPDLFTWAEDLAAVARQAWLALADGGRLVVNVANSGRKPYQDLAGLVGVTLGAAGFELRGHIIWHKGYGVAGTAWGSGPGAGGRAALASAPSLRDVHEYLVIAQKGAGPLDVASYPRRVDLTGAEFGRLTFSVWEVPVNRRDPWQKACKHPAPWPLELARRMDGRPALTAPDQARWRTCPGCGQALPEHNTSEHGAGRRRLYCSERCRRRAANVRQMR